MRACPCMFACARVMMAISKLAAEIPTLIPAPPFRHLPLDIIGAVPSSVRIGRSSDVEVRAEFGLRFRNRTWLSRAGPRCMFRPAVAIIERRHFGPDAVDVSLIVLVGWRVGGRSGRAAMPVLKG